jgi:magnesium transporter
MVEKTAALESLVGEQVEEVRELLANRDQSSLFEDYPTFQFLTIRGMRMDHSALEFQSETFLIFTDGIHHYDRSSLQFVKLRGGYKRMLELLEHTYVVNQKIISAYANEVEKLEESLFERKIPTYFMDVWFDLKKDLAKIENFYYRNSIVYKEFYKKCEKSFQKLTDEFKDIDDTIQFQNSNLVTLKARIDSLHHYYVSIKSDRLNKTLLALTLISGVFLPLNLIVGFFGMNTEGLYLKEDPSGTQTVLIMLLAIVVLALLGLPVLRLIDKYILRYLLGQYDFYKSLSNRIARELPEQNRPR